MMESAGALHGGITEAVNSSRVSQKNASALIDGFATRKYHDPHFVRESEVEAVKPRQAVIEIPASLLDELSPSDRPIVHAWWVSLLDSDRTELTSLMEDKGVMPTFPLALEDERESEYLDAYDDLYEYWANHELKTTHVSFFGPREIYFRGIALLSPLWPPYPNEVRYRPWELTDTLYAQLRTAFDGQKPRE